MLLFLKSQSFLFAGGDTNNLFTINSTSGDITLTQALDRETSDQFTLIVQAVSANAGAPDQAKFVNNLARCACREAPSVVTVRITVQDVNDNKPEFSQQDMFACKSDSAVCVWGSICLAFFQIFPPVLNVE